MIVNFPYKEFDSLDVPDKNLMGIYALPAVNPLPDLSTRVAEALADPVGTPPLRELARNKRRLLIVTDDVSRPTPVHLLLPPLLRELHAAGAGDDGIEFMFALGSHRFMTPVEMADKLGPDVAARYKAHNHDWKDRDACSFMGKTAEGAEVWINKKVREADLVIGVGRIMPIDVCGFTGGGKILIPGVCGRVTNSQMHWTRVRVPDEEVVGRRDNPIRKSIDDMARTAGLNFILNVVLNGKQEAVAVVAGDLEAAHRLGCEQARRVHEVHIPAHPDIVVADGHPFDIEFWQVNKALDSAGTVVRKGGVVIMISPCYEGFSRSHPEILQFGYRPVNEIIQLVETGQIRNKVVGVHMIQVSRVAVEKATGILVTSGIRRADVERAGLRYAATPAEALSKAFDLMGAGACVGVLRNAAEMLPIVDNGRMAR